MRGFFLMWLNAKRGTSRMTSPIDFERHLYYQRKMEKVIKQKDSAEYELLWILLNHVKRVVFTKMGTEHKCQKAIRVF